MKSRALLILIVLNAALAVALAYRWVGRDGQIRNSTWREPAAIKPDFASMTPGLARPGADSASQFVATLDRPLFSPNRKPPPVVSTQAPPPDPLASIQLVGVYGGQASGGIIARVDGKMRRAQINEKIGDWTIKEVVDRSVTFVRGGESRVIRLVRGQQGASTAASPVPAADPKLQMTGAQRAQEEERARLRYLNEMNARNGLPPIINR